MIDPTICSEEMSMTHKDLVKRLRRRYSAETVPPCPVCNEPLTIQAAGGGSITWGCTKRDEGVSPLDDHYDRSRFEQRHTGDADVLALIDHVAANPNPPQGQGLREALEWYGEQARLARLIHSEGDAGRHALAEDGGNRARAALGTSPAISDEAK